MRSFLLLCLLSACAGDDSDTDAITTEIGDLAATGEFGVGTVSTSFTGPNGDTTPLQIWYPTSAASGITHKYDGLVLGGAWQDAPADCSVARPVVVFSHGNMGVRWQSYPIIEHIVSHGYVVVAPDHVGNSFPSPSQPFHEILLRRPLDVSTAFDAALGMEQVVGCMDATAGYAVMGHSFGGYTASVVGGAEIVRVDVQALCDGGEQTACDTLTSWDETYGTSDRLSLADDRAWAVIGLSPWDGFVLNEGLDAVSVPTMYVTGARDVTTPLEGTVRRMYSHVGTQPRALAVFPDAGHFSFAYSCALLNDGDGCGDGWTPLPEVHVATSAASLAWLGMTLGDARYTDRLPVNDEAIVWEAVGI